MSICPDLTTDRPNRNCGFGTPGAAPGGVTCKKQNVAAYVYSLQEFDLQNHWEELIGSQYI